MTYLHCAALLDGLDMGCTVLGSLDVAGASAWHVGRDCLQLAVDKFDLLCLFDIRTPCTDVQNQSGGLQTQSAEKLLLCCTVSL